MRSPVQIRAPRLKRRTEARLRGQRRPEGTLSFMPEPGEREPSELDGPEEGGRELSHLRPFSRAQAREQLRRYLAEYQSKSGNLTPKEQAKLALLIEFCVEDD